MIILSDKIKYISTLISGTALSQLISIISTFILARIYTPDSFGVFGSALAICTIMSVMIGLKYELTVIFPKTERVASLASALSVLVVLFLTLVAFLLLTFVSYLHLINLDFPVITYITITALLAFEQISMNWLVRTKSFKIIAYIAILKTTSIAVLQILLSDTTMGLWYGYLLGNLIAAFFYLLFTFRSLVGGIHAISFNRISYFLTRNKKFPKYSLPAGTLNSFGNQIPILLIRSLFGEQYAGYFLLIRKLILAPAILISTNINKVLSQDVTKRIAQNKPYLENVIFYIQLSAILSLITFTFILIFIYNNGIAIIMGENWNEAVALAYILLPFAIFSFIARSVSRFAIYGKNEWGLYYQCIFALMSTLSIYLCSLIVSDFKLVMSSYSLIMSIIYITQIFMVINVAKNHYNKLSY